MSNYFSTVNVNLKSYCNLSTQRGYLNKPIKKVNPTRTLSPTKLTSVLYAIDSIQLS